MFPSNPGNRRQYFYLPEGETSEVQSSADASCISREDLDSKGCQLHWADHCKYRNDRSGGGRNQFGFETIIYRRKSVFPDYCGSSMGTVSLRDMLADSFVDVLLSKDGDGPDLFTWDGSEFDSFDCLDNRIQMVDESVCNFAKADVSGSSNTAKRTSGSAGKCHVYAAGTGKECDRSGNLTQYGIICPVDSYDSKMVSEEDGSRMGKIKKLVGSEFLKLKGTWIFWIHLGVPVAGAGLFLLYGVAAKREWQSVLEFYAETLAIVYPSVSAIICMQSVMQELKAGNFQNLLCVSTLRWSAVLRKILTLWILGLAASLLAFLLFGMGVWGTKAAWNLSVKEYLICGLILWITQAGIYLLHFFLAMRLGSGACLAAGVTQSLIAALLFTGLGDGLWMWFPCGWSGHLLLYYVKWKTESEVFKMAGEMLKEQIRTGVLSMVGMTITGLILWCIWIQHHDRKSISQ